MHGLTLVELMVSLTLSMFVVLVAASILLSSKRGYLAVDDGTRLQEAGRFGIELISRNVRQTSFENLDKDDARISVSDAISANIAGLDNVTIGESQAFISGATPVSDANNDVLGLKFFGSGSGSSGDGTIVDCAGFGIPAPSSASAAESERGASVFYVAKSSSGVAELRCKYFAGGSWQSEAILTGVDSFQVLYGLDLTGNGIPTRYVRAGVINALDSQLVKTASTAAGTRLEDNRRTHWKKVVAIKIALLLSGNQKGRPDAQDARYDLFGERYGDEYGDADPGTRIVESKLPVNARDRMRKLFTATIQVRNRSGA